MKDDYYSDDKDLVKWASLMHIARQTQATTIFQILMLQRSRRRPPPITHNGQIIEFPQEVWTHFKTTAGIAGLSNLANINVERFAEPFIYRQTHGTRSAARQTYFERAIDRVNKLAEQRIVVCLDPCTGFSPENTEWDHLTATEATRVYDALKSGDSLTVYQHNTHRQGWADAAQQTFARAAGVPLSRVGVFRAPTIPDVVMYAVTK